MSLLNFLLIPILAGPKAALSQFKAIDHSFRTKQARALFSWYLLPELDVETVPPVSPCKGSPLGFSRQDFIFFSFFLWS